MIYEKVRAPETRKISETEREFIMNMIPISLSRLIPVSHLLVSHAKVEDGFLIIYIPFSDNDADEILTVLERG